MNKVKEYYRARIIAGELERCLDAEYGMRLDFVGIRSDDVGDYAVLHLRAVVSKSADGTEESIMPEGAARCFVRAIHARIYAIVRTARAVAARDLYSLGLKAKKKDETIASEISILEQEPDEDGEHPVAMSDSVGMSTMFIGWWYNVGSGIVPTKTDDMETHAKRVAAAAWSSAWSLVSRLFG